MSQLINQKFLQGIDSSKFKIAANGALIAIDSQGNEVEILKLNAQNQALVLGIRPANKADLDQAIADLTAEIAAREVADQALSGRITSLETEMPNKASITYVNTQDGLTLGAAKLYADQKVEALVNGAPGVLDTLKEIADALGNDANLAGTLSGQIAAVQNGLSVEISRASAAEAQALADAKVYADNKDALEASARIAGDAFALSESKAYTDSKIAAIPSVDLSNYYTKPQVDAVDNALAARITALENYDQETVFVDNVNGVDAVGRGTMLRPYKTINYAYSQVESLGAPSNTSYNANVGRFVTEKLVIHLAPGRYEENVVLGFKRARVRLTGDGATVVGDVKMSVKLADFPASNLENMKSSFPAPYTGASAFMNFEIAGKSGGGLESDPTANVLVITGQASIAFEEASVPGSGVSFPNWDGSFGQFYAYLDGASLGNFVVTTSYTADMTRALPSGVIEVESCNIAASSASYRMHMGLVPYSYLADFATWSVATKGSTNKAPSGTWTLKAHNSTFGNVIGPRLTIGEMDGCRIYDIDRTMRGTVDNGAISGSTSTSYLGFVNNQFRIYGGSGDLASAYKIGQASGSTRYKMDSVSYTTLAFSRNSSGVLAARTLDVGGGVSYDLLDDARSINVADPATNYTRSANTVDSALEGIDAALGLKANQSALAQEIIDRQAGDSALQSGLNTEISARQSADSALSGRITALENAPSGPSFKYKTVTLNSGSDLQYIDLDFQAKENGVMCVALDRLMLVPGLDFSISVVGGKTRLTWINDLVSPGGDQSVEEGDVVFVSYAV